MNSEKPYVEEVYNNIVAISEFLSKLKPQGDDEANDLILHEKGNFDFHSRKFIVIMAASDHEKRITEILEKYIKGTNNTIVKHLALKAIGRQYSKLFDFNLDTDDEGVPKNVQKKIKNFFGNFGKDFRAHCNSILTNDENLSQSIKNFLLINYWRNNIVHGRHDKKAVKILPSVKTIYQLFKDSQEFIEWLPGILEDYGKIECSKATPLFSSQNNSEE